MDYLGIVKKAFSISLKHRYLWILGILAAFTEGGMFFPNYFNYGLDSTDFFKQNQPTQFIPKSAELSKVLGASTSSVSPTVNWLSNHTCLIGIFILLLALFIFIVFIISTMARAGLIDSVNKIDEDEKSSFRKGLGVGYHAFWRLVALGIILSLLFLIFIALLIFPVVGLILLKNYWLALAIGLVLLPILFVAMIYLNLLSTYAMRFFVINGQGVRQGIKNSQQLLIKFTKEIIFIWLIAIALGIGVTTVFGLISVFVLLPFIAAGIGIYALGGLTAILIYGIIFGLILLLASLLLTGISNTFFSTYWTLSFKSLVDTSTSLSVNPERSRVG